MEQHSDWSADLQETFNCKMKAALTGLNQPGVPCIPSTHALLPRLSGTPGTLSQVIGGPGCHTRGASACFRCASAGADAERPISSFPGRAASSFATASSLPVLTVASCSSDGSPATSSSALPRPTLQPAQEPVRGGVRAQRMRPAAAARAAAPRRAARARLAPHAR